MSFCSVADVVDRLSFTGLLYQVDDDDDAESQSESAELVEDADSIESCIRYADEEIKRALLTYTETPTQYEGNETLRGWAVDLASERLCERKGQEVAESFLRAAQRTRENLTQFASGQMMIPGIVPPVVQRIEFRNLGRPRIARR